VALTIFHSQPDRHLSGVLAARLFAIESYLGLVVVLAALLVRAARFRFGFLAVALLLGNEWVIKAFMDQAMAQGAALGLGFGPWHGISALIYLCACFAVAVAVCRHEW
jgi:presenilin-like A22 family membrane protease